MVILINNDNTATITERDTIMQREKLVNRMSVICPKIYNDIDMLDFDLLLTYKLPISNGVKIVNMTMTDDNYKDDYYKYDLTIDTDITAENGDVVLQFAFMRTYLDDSGKNIQQVRNINDMLLHICQLSDWLVLSDAALSTLAELYLNNKNMIKSVEQLAATLYQEKLNDITLDIDGKRIVGTANGNVVGEGISLEELNNELVEVGSETTGNVKIQNI